ncbi:MAG: site-2 protease family protein [Candidatus Omnitrophota bacterium]
MNILVFLVYFGLLMISMTVHEFFHGWTAYKFGDTTAKYSGRLTLNPLAHIDLIGTIILPLSLFIATSGHFVFGAAKPVPINYMALRNPKRDIIWVGASGPLANFVFAFLLTILWKFLPSTPALNFILKNLILINLVLGVFNLVPVPPLDGSRIIMPLLPANLASRYASLEPYGFMILILLIWFGIFDYIIWPIVSFMMILFMSIF